MYFSRKQHTLQNLDPNSGETEKLHWHSFKTGNAASFEHLYQKYSAGLYNYGAKFSGDKDLIKECIQELFVQIWTKRSSIGNPEHIKNYLYKSFRNLILKKTAQLQKNQDFDDIENYGFNVSLNIEDALIDGERREKISGQLQEAISRLTARQKEAIFLRFYEQLSYEEIAEIMGITVKASYKIMARSLSFLRNNLSKEDLLILYMACHMKLLN